MKSISKLLTASTLLIASNANAAMITLTADVFSAENYGGLIAGVSQITADVTIDDVIFDALTGIGDETVSFTGTNTLNITAGTLSFDQTMDSDANTSITFRNGQLYDLDFGAIFGTNSAPEEFNSNLDSIAADRVVQGQGAKNDVSLFATWDSSTVYITPVPVPAAVWLFGSGLIGLVGLARRKAA